MKNIYAIVLAAGKGTRMESDLPKVLHKICNRPMLGYILDTLDQLQYPVVLVVGYKRELVQDFCKKKYKYAIQDKQLGTGHAVLCAKEKIPEDIQTIMVLNGDDSAFYKQQTLENLMKKHLEYQNKISFLSLIAPEPTGFGRVKRDKDKKILGIVEEKNASEEEKKITEINLGTYCFDADFLWQNLPKLSKNRCSGEYYITDLIALAIQEKKKVEAFPLQDQKEWVGVNTPKQLQKANKLMQKCLTIKKSRP